MVYLIKYLLGSLLGKLYFWNLIFLFSLQVLFLLKSSESPLCHVQLDSSFTYWSSFLLCTSSFWWWGCFLCSQLTHTSPMGTGSIIIDIVHKSILDTVQKQALGVLLKHRFHGSVLSEICKRKQSKQILDLLHLNPKQNLAVRIKPVIN